MTSLYDGYPDPDLSYDLMREDRARIHAKPNIEDVECDIHDRCILGGHCDPCGHCDCVRPGTGECVDENEVSPWEF